MARETPDKITAAALAAFAKGGYDATSLDSIAGSLSVTKQTILYWFPSKEALLGAVIARCANELTAALSSAIGDSAQGWDRVEAVIKAVFRLAVRKPELLLFLREASRLGPPASTEMATALEPLLAGASAFLTAEMQAGRMRQSDPNFLLLALYSMVLGIVTEVEVVQALGIELSARSLLQRRREVLDLLHSALIID